MAAAAEGSGGGGVAVSETARLKCLDNFFVFFETNSSVVPRSLSLSTLIPPAEAAFAEWGPAWAESSVSLTAVHDVLRAGGP